MAKTCLIRRSSCMYFSLLELGGDITSLPWQVIRTDNTSHQLFRSLPCLRSSYFFFFLSGSIPPRKKKKGQKNSNDIDTEVTNHFLLVRVFYGVTCNGREEGQPVNFFGVEEGSSDTIDADLILIRNEI